MRADLLRAVAIPLKPVPAAPRLSLIPRPPPYIADTTARPRRPVVIGGIVAFVGCLLAVALVASGGSPHFGPGAAGRDVGQSASSEHSRTTGAMLTPKASGTSASVTASAGTAPDAAESTSAQSTALSASTGTAVLADPIPAQSPAPGSAQSPTSIATQPIYDRYLRNVVTGLCADLPGADDGGGLDAPVIHHPCIAAASDNQKWDLIYRTTMGNDQYYWIKNQRSGLCMDLPGFGAVPAGTYVTQYTCRDNDNPTLAP
jgi:hypothetical protein